jgi:hypothetical protein
VGARGSPTNAGFFGMAFSRPTGGGASPTAMGARPIGASPMGSSPMRGRPTAGLSFRPTESHSSQCGLDRANSDNNFGGNFEIGGFLFGSIFNTYVFKDMLHLLCISTQ